MKKKILVKLLILAAAPLIAFKPAGAQTQPKGGAMDAIRSKIALEAQIEERLRAMLTSFLNTGEVAVAVKVNLLVKKPEAEQGSSVRKWDEKEEIILPGVPAAASMTKENPTAAADAARNAVRLGVSSINIWVIVGKPVPEETDARIRKIISDALDLQIEAGDTVTIESAAREGMGLSVNTGALVALICLAVLAIFLYGPFRGFLKRLNENLAALSMNAPAAGGTDTAISGEEGPESAMTGALNLSGGAGSSALTFESGENAPLEKYVTKENVDDLVLILQNEPPEVIAKVVQRIPPKLAFAAIPKYRMREVLEQFLKREFSEPEAIKTLFNRIRDKMSGSFGGDTRLGHIVQVMDRKSQESALVFIREKDAAFAAALETRFFRFADLLRYDETALRRIFRKAGAESFARCLRNCDETTTESFFEMLGPAIKDLVSARMQSIVTVGDSNDSELNILNAVNALSSRGIILSLAEVKQNQGG